MRIGFIVKFWNKKTAFTLGELLVTLGVLGSVAALTLPTIAYNYRGKVLEQQFRSTYSEIKEIGSRMNLEHGDLGTFAYNCVYGSSTFKCGQQKANNGGNLYGGTDRWASEFVSNLTGGGPFNEKANSTTGISATLQTIYRDAGAPIGPKWFDKRTAGNGPGIVCDNGGIWTDAKGRIWTFNGENQFVCVDINGTVAPNRMNVDTFIFKPMSAREMAVYVYDDPDHPNNYSGQFVPCDINKISGDNWGNSMPQQKGFARGSGSAVDWCPFNEPLENIAPRIKNRYGVVTGNSLNSTGNKTMNRNSTYWRDYIDYR